MSVYCASIGNHGYSGGVITYGARNIQSTDMLFVSISLISNIRMSVLFQCEGLTPLPGHRGFLHCRHAEGEGGAMGDVSPVARHTD